MRARIVGDNFSGFEVQLKRKFSPFWYQAHNGRSAVNTYRTLAEAEEFACKRLRDRKFIREITIADCPLCKIETPKRTLS